MRAGFLILSLLIVVGIMLMLYRTSVIPTAEVGKQTQDVAQQMSGHDANGQAAMNSFKCEEFDQGNQFRGIKITDVTAGGAMDTAYGLKVGDVVLQIGEDDVTMFGGYDMAKGLLQQAYQENHPLVVLRDGNKTTLTPNGPMNALNIPQ
jgi:C-terminal processing protease CtpA/Prc